GPAAGAGRGLVGERPAPAAQAHLRAAVGDARQPAAADPPRGGGDADGDARSRGDAGRDPGATAIAGAAPERAAGSRGAARAAREELLWREVVGRVNATKRMLGAFLEESRFVGLSDAGLVLETDDLHATVIDEKENRTIVNDAIRQVFAAHVAFRCVRPSQP